MTITSTRIIDDSEIPNGKKSPKPPPRIYYAPDPPYKGYQPAPSEAYKQSNSETVIVIDNGMLYILSN